MSANCNEDNLELLLESLIKMQAKLIENMDSLTKRMNQVEYAIQKTSHQDMYYVELLK